MVKPTTGELSVNGFTPAKMEKEYLINIGVVFGHKSSLWWDLPVKESFKTQKSIYKINDEDYQARMELLSNKLDLKSVLNRPAKYLT